MVYEACVETFEEALAAAQGGANRIELCSHPELDGLTPSPELVKRVCKGLEIPVMVMIRPRGGHFVYSETEIEEMERDIEMAGNCGAAGVVLGLLTTDNLVDTLNIRRLATLACPLQVTFHKAIDRMANPPDGVRQLLDIEGVTRVLTSGGQPTAREGAATIREMVRVADGRLQIIAAGKVTFRNRDEIAALTGATELHGRKITRKGLIK